jgi:hypothetical protein
MPNPRKGAVSRKKSGGVALKPKPPRSGRGDLPELPKPAQSLRPPGTAMKKVIIVHDAAGKIVSITQVAPGATHGVGVRPNPGYSVREVEVKGALAEEPLGGIPQKYEFDLKTGQLKKGRS